MGDVSFSIFSHDDGDFGAVVIGASAQVHLSL